MRQALRCDDLAPLDNAAVPETSARDTAEYLYHLLNSLQKMSAAKDLTIVARLVGLARDEARKNF